MSNQYWTLVIITGASKGFGECIAKAYVSTLIENSSPSTNQLHLVLTARSAADLNVVKESIMQMRGSIVGDLLIDTVVSDLSNGPSLEVLARNLFDQPFSRDQDTKPRVYNKVIFANNAGSLGPLQV
jgi:NADP-dependent 3-hydroxy acid dehydrogenase YdfG